MNEIATTSEAPTERLETDSASEPTEIASTSEVNSATAERPTEDSFDAGIKIDELPENVRDAARTVEKQFKAAYTRKTQEMADHRKKSAYESEQVKSQLDQFSKIVQDVLQNPDKVNSYRKVFGFEDAPAAQPEPQFETVGDLVNHYESKMAQLKQDMAQTVEQKIAQKDAQREQMSRWSGAVLELRKDPVYAKYENIIVKMVQDGAQYKEGYYPGNETTVLKRGLEDFKNLLKPDLEAAKNEVIQSYAKKKQEATFVPKKTVETITPGQKLDKEQVIARIRQRLGG